MEKDGIIIALSYQYPPEALDDQGQPMYSVELPLLLMVVESQEAKERIITEAYRDLKYNSYYRLEGLYKRLALEYLNISKHDVQEALNKLEIYQMNMPFKPAIVKPIVSMSPMQQWEIDLVEFTDLAAHNSNYKYLMNVIDTFSKFVWSVPIHNKESATVVKHLEKNFLVEGAPKIISSDNGREFKSHLMSDMLKEYNVQQIFSLPYKPQSQGQVERFNSTLKSKIYSYMNDKSTQKYVDALPKIVFSYNNTVHSTIKQTPFQVHRGLSAKLSLLHKSVYKAIQTKATNMIDSSHKKLSKDMERLDVGNSVRIATAALKQFRKKQQFAKALKHPKWTPYVYKVKQVKKDEKQNELFKLEMEDKDPDDRWYFRYELLKTSSTSTPTCQEPSGPSDPSDPSNLLVETQEPNEGLLKRRRAHVNYRLPRCDFKQL